MPPALAAATNATRTISGSTPIWRASPEHTPAITRLFVSRRSTGAWRVAVTASMIPGASVAADQAAREQDRAGNRARERAERGEAEGQHVGAVQQEDRAEDHDRDARDERGQVRPPPIHGRHRRRRRCRAGG